jgi:ADP-ribose pyrophosphatase YjhB (NUDIX family)
MNINETIEYLDKCAPDPKRGLPDEIFYFVSRMTPLINVDLLIKDEKGRSLLAWRDDQYAGKGWHLPGGIIRFKETIKKRLEKVAETEIGVKVKFESGPIAINEIIIRPKTRGHFISFLYKCHLSGNYIPENKGLKETDAGYLKWHAACPNNLLKLQNIYKKFL